MCINIYCALHESLLKGWDVKEDKGQRSLFLNALRLFQKMLTQNCCSQVPCNPSGSVCTSFGALAFADMVENKICSQHQVLDKLLYKRNKPSMGKRENAIGWSSFLETDLGFEELL